MTELVLPAPPTPTVAVAGSAARFPVRRIFCVGRNYAAHAREFGNDPDREPPFFFTKPGDAVIDDGAVIPYPPETQNLHFEGELVVAIGKAGFQIDEAEALSHVWGYAAGNDLTRRDLQNQAKEMRRPWDFAKGFDRSALCGPLVRAEEMGRPAGVIRLLVNDEVKQDAKLADLIWDVAGVIAFLSRSLEIAPGDLIYTGTPAGVGALEPGDVCTTEIEGLPSATLTLEKT